MKELVFIDDSGDPGFVPGASSERLVMAAVVFSSSDEATDLNEEISRLRKLLGWRDNHEFKFSKTSKEIRSRFLRLVSGCRFDIYAVYIDKTRYANVFQLVDRARLYNWTTEELLRIIPLNNAYVKIDGRADKTYRLAVTAHIRKKLNMPENYKVKRVVVGDSKKDNLIQLADMVVGAMNRSFQTEKTDAGDYIKIIKNKIVEIKQLDL